MTRRDERGYTLIEMMIATALLSLVTAAAFGAVNVMTNQAAATSDRFTAEGQGQTIADRITKDLRTAVAPTSTTDAFASAASNDVVFYASLSDLSLPIGTGPIRLHAYTSLVPGTSVYIFHEDATPPDSYSPGNYTYTGTPVSRIDGEYIDSSQPIFSYWDSAGNPINAPVPASQLGDIDAVGITLRIRVHPHSPVVVISTRIHIRNVDYNPGS
jgi:prepilin-type N-terminal cleavage/methylation domain-containing protein